MELSGEGMGDNEVEESMREKDTISVQSTRVVELGHISCERCRDLSSQV